MPGYHVNEIKKGTLGTSGKIQEELDELKDAESQNVKLLMLCELADLIGSIQFYLNFRFPGWTVRDLEAMSRLTEQAFRSGQRYCEEDQHD